MGRAKEAIDEVYTGTYEKKGMEKSAAWPDALEPFLEEIEQLLGCPMGEESAWKASLAVGKLCALPEEGDECQFEEGEEECDAFHDAMDDLMVKICQKVEDHRYMICLPAPERKAEVDEVACSATWEIFIGEHEGKNPGECRYKKIMSFLKNVK